MAKTKISEFSSTPANNTDIDSINIAEGCAPSNINDAIRELMAQLKDFQIGSQGDSFNGPIGTSTAAAGAFTTLSASGSVTLSGGTANGVTYLNGSKVLTSGSALTFDGQYVSIGSGASSPNGIKFLANGGGLAANLTVNHSTGEIQNFATTNYFPTWYANNSEQMRLTTAGNLGIGTSSPTSKLHIKGSGLQQLTIESTTTNPVLFFGTASGQNPYIQWQSTGGSALKFYDSTVGLDRLVIDASGNLGLGVTPTAGVGDTKHIELPGGGVFRTKDVNVDLGANYYYDSAYKYIVTGAASRFEQNSGAYRWYSAPSGTAGNAITFTQAMTLDASGNLGVGTTSAGTRLHAVGGNVWSSNFYEVGRFQKSSGTGVSLGYDNTAYVATIAAYSHDGTASNLSFWTYPGSGVALERARITSSGYFKASNTGSYANPTGAYHELVNSDTRCFQFRSTATTGDLSNYIEFTGQSPNNTTSAFLYCTDTSATRFGFRSNGGLANYSANNVNLSDRREKTNFAPAGSYIDKICAIPVQTFNYIDQNLEEDAGLTLGVVAQDVQAVAPELVTESNWGTEEEPKMRLSIYQTDLQYALMKCIQEQQSIIESLKARLDAANI